MRVRSFVSLLFLAFAHKYPDINNKDDAETPQYRCLIMKVCSYGKYEHYGKMVSVSIFPK